MLREGRCALPTLRNITRQICCCSRVGKAWGPACQRCPPFGSGEPPRDPPNPLGSPPKKPFRADPPPKKINPLGSLRFMGFAPKATGSPFGGGFFGGGG